MDLAVVFADFDRDGVANGLLQPVLAVIAVVRRPFLEKPHHAGQKAFAPVRPNLAFVLPAAVTGVHRIEIRMVLDQLAYLLAGKAESLGEQLAVGFEDELDHRGLLNDGLRWR